MTHHIDLRDERCTRYGPTGARPGATPQVPSPNLKKVMEAIATGELAPLIALGDRIENGNATESEEERGKVYDALPLLLGYVLDLSEMCLRRERALNDCDVGFGFKLD